MPNDTDDFVCGGERGRTAEDEAKAKGFINYTLAPGDVLCICPYNNAHRVRTAKLTGHLVKCRSAHLKKMSELGQEPEFKICRYNTRHHIPSLELEDHEMNCPDAIQVISHIQQMQELDEAIEHAKKIKGELPDTKNEPISSFIGAVNTQIEGGTNVNEDDDSWEVESRDNIRRGIKSYDPQDKLRKEAGKIIQSMPGISTRSERKAFNKHKYEMFNKRGGEFNEDGPSKKSKPDVTSS